MVAELSKALSQIPVERMPWVPGSNPRSGFDIDRSEVAIQIGGCRVTCVAYNIALQPNPDSRPRSEPTL